ncbi:putative lipid II flippase FtsW [Dorea longicatena]|uniref:FtsW/RodA/SpoVE family cell cycle protein n=1 Tax=Dorea longicatena TaxID=88431 RepID=UPI001D029328|nr:putative peptidoglycan glycosyltransferase FtsW [Dorea longicatena]MCB5536284.1 putative lipid II flippase FtsW [bacterium MSK17_88]MCB5546937.1 putative lipid II flippase FtsW [Dorea longicatena]MCG4574339.1 putative lipid II flippase FtsW [Dorea longicatena]
MVKENKKRSTNTRVKKKEHSIAYFDYSLLAILICLICFGLVMLYSTSSYSAMMKQNGDSLFYFKRQVLFCIVGLIGMWIVSRIDYHWYFERSKFFYFISIFMMFLVKTPLGKEVNGAKRWIKLPLRQQLQPAEIAKIAIILFIPALICTMGREIKTLEGIVKVLAWGAFSAAVVFIITENLSTAIIVMGITCIMIFVVHPKTRIFIIIAVGIILIGIVGARVLGMAMETSGNFRLRRILVWLNPEKYASEGGYQIMQALYAIGSGGFFGKGLGNSAQKMIIPEVQNDMILSIICEELGVFGAIMVLILFGMLLYRLLFIAQNAPDLYGSLVVSGIFAHIALQVILNVMVVINCIPTTGITLPFISYGGTSVLFLMAEMGLALGVSSKIKIAE